MLVKSWEKEVSLGNKRWYKITRQNLKNIVELIKDYRLSSEYSDIVLQNDYYANIQHKKYQDAIYNNISFRYKTKGEESRISVAFFRKLVDQKVNYLLGNNPTIEADERVVSFFDFNILRKMHSACSDCIKHGQGWLMACYNSEGKLSFIHVPTEEVYPVWRDYERTKLESVYRFFRYNNKDYIIVYDNEGITTIEDGKIVSLNQPLLTLGQNSISYIPFVYFDYNTERASLLDFIKDLIDDYNNQISSRSSNLLNITNAIKVVKNYDGKSLTEAEEMMNRNRIIGVTEQGDVKVIEVPIESIAVDAQLDQAIQDIYDAGRGVNFSRENLGNASGIALKFKYSDLDADTDNMGMHFRESLYKMYQIIKFDLALRGEVVRDEFKVIFNKNRIINETEIIENLTKLNPFLSRELVLTLLPFDIDIEEELKRPANEREEMYNYDEYGTDSNNNQKREEN